MQTVNTFYGIEFLIRNVIVVISQEFRKVQSHVAVRICTECIHINVSQFIFAKSEITSKLDFDAIPSYSHITETERSNIFSISFRFVSFYIFILFDVV